VATVERSAVVVGLSYGPRLTESTIGVALNPGVDAIDDLLGNAWISGLVTHAGLKFVEVDNLAQV
jgi:hypothetical protein